MSRIAETIKRRMPILFGLVMGTLAMLFMQSYIAQQQRRLRVERDKLMQDYKEPIKVVVASKDLIAGMQLETSHLAIASVPEKFVQPYAVRSPRDLLGLVTVAPIAQGEQVLLNKVRRPEAVPADATLASLLPEGRRAVTIGVDAITGVGGFVRPGDKVDVLWGFKLPKVGDQDGQIVMLTLFQDVPILAVGSQMLGRTTQTSEASRDYTVTLALDPQEISFLLFAREQGRIQLSLRSHREGEAQVAITPTNINTLLEAKLGVKSDAPPPKPARQVEIFKGLKRDVVLLPEEQPTQ
jgi:pilus assembly protein CpaB